MIVDGQARDSEQHTGVEASHEQPHVLYQHSDEPEQKAGTQSHTCNQSNKVKSHFIKQMSKRHQQIFRYAKCIDFIKIESPTLQCNAPKTVVM